MITYFGDLNLFCFHGFACCLRCMEVVRRFLDLRRNRKGAEAFELVAANATIGAPWGIFHGDSEVSKFLKDEENFLRREYLLESSISRIDDYCYQREYRFNAMIRGQSPFPIRTGKYREVFHIDNDSKICLLTCNLQPRRWF